MFDSVNRDNTLKVFLSGRMPPENPEHKKFIDKELSKMAVDDPNAAAALKQHYEDKLIAYMEANPDPVVEVPVQEVIADFDAETVITEAPKKKGKGKHSASTAIAA